eukprot:Sspe_Gene.45884::Locus_22788_Transcript_1_1_Confidence_1.000_Length_1644::g.45884::m.45884
MEDLDVDPSQQLLKLEEEVVKMYHGDLGELDQWGLFVPRSRIRHPMVVVLGNYSAGKSSLVNDLMGVNVQESGVAPTDDGFTVLLRDTVDNELDGSALVADPNFGFNDLSVFGHPLQARLRLKQRVCPPNARLPFNVMLVDTPGLIDLPRPEGEGKDVFPQESMHQVIRWFTDRADLILFMFDPEKPGIIQETHQVLAMLLQQGSSERKVKFIFNKVDQLASTTDFIGTYGTLCWSLSKVIHRKDPPPIYTIFTPGLANPLPHMTSTLEECKHQRANLLEMVRRVPIDRADNMIKQLEETKTRIFMASRVCNEVLSRHTALRRKAIGYVSMLSLVLAALLAHLHSTIEEADPLSPLFVNGLCVSLTIAVTVGLAARHWLRSNDKLLLINLDDSFNCCYADSRPIRSSKVSDEVKETWCQVKSTMSLEPSHTTFRYLRAISSKTLRMYEERCDDVIQKLRSRAVVYRQHLLCQTTPSHSESSVREQSVSPSTPANPPSC